MARETRLADSLKLGSPIVLLVLIGFAITYRFVGPPPPDRLVLATGEASGAYAALAPRYVEILAENGIELELRPSAGSAESLLLLRQGEVDVAFVQGGVATEAQREGLESLGSLYFEPLWVFHRKSLEIDRLSELAGRRVSAGPVGSGTRAVALELLRENGVFVDPLAMGSSEAAIALAEGKLDAVFLIASLESETVQSLLLGDRVRPLSLRRAPAYERTHRFLSRVILPEGVIDYTSNVPDHAIELVATTANLVVRNEVHPALLDLLVQAADRIHREGGVFEDPGAFPTPRFVDFPLNKEARRFYENGPPFLQRYLPFWLATAVDRLKVLLIPLVALLIPLFRVFPPLYRWRVRSRIYRWYDELREIDPRDRSDLDLRDALVQARRIEDEVAQIPAPPSYAQELYDLRIHIDFIGRRLVEAASERDESADSDPSKSS